MHYQNDLRLRWSPADLAAQQDFVVAQLGELDWLDWSGDAAALELIQSEVVDISAAPTAKCMAILVAGPITELIQPARLFAFAARHLRPVGRLVGIIPCLRDNSPESRLFAERAAAELWPYHTAEELRELLREAGFEPVTGATGFTPIPQFNRVVLRDQLGFKAYKHLFTQLEAEGYDPAEIGWGELRFVATMTGESPS